MLAECSYSKWTLTQNGLLISVPRSAFFKMTYDQTKTTNFGQKAKGQLRKGGGIEEVRIIEDNRGRKI